LIQNLTPSLTIFFAKDGFDTTITPKELNEKKTIVSVNFGHLLIKNW
jgi:hypothetical protein